VINDQLFRDACSPTLRADRVERAVLQLPVSRRANARRARVARPALAPRPSWRCCDQVNPHFLFNSLNSLRALIDEIRWRRTM